MKTEHIIGLIVGGTAIGLGIYFLVKKPSGGGNGTTGHFLKEDILNGWLSKYEVRRGETVQVWARFKNSQSKTFSGTWNHEVFGFGGAHIPITIRPGDTIEVNRDWTVPNDLANGTYALSIYIGDTWNTFPERVKVIG